MRFIDRSGNNGADHYAQAGVTDLYLKATEGTGYSDPSYRNRHAQAIAEGIHRVGAYHFADLADPVAEAKHFLSVIGTPVAGRLRPALDLERGAVVSDVAWAERFVTYVQGQLGYWPVLYGSTSLIAPMRAESKTLRACPWWRAEYGVNDGALHPLEGGPQGAIAHQYTSRGSFPGISGVTDASVYVSNPAALVVPERLKATVTTGSGERFVYLQGTRLWRVRAAARVLGLLRAGRRVITVKVTQA